MQFVPLEPGIEVAGPAIYSIVDGFGLFRRTVSAIMQQEGIGRMTADGDLQIDRDGWYSQAAYLRAFARVAKESGDGALFATGRRIPENVEMPGAVDIVSQIQVLDAGYHLNHRKGGVVMFDPQTGKMLDGIGSYSARVEGPNRMTVTCDNPYPCEFDRGVISALARRFKPHASVTHDEHGPCRKRDQHACIYIVSW